MPSEKMLPRHLTLQEREELSGIKWPAGYRPRGGDRFYTDRLHTGRPVVGIIQNGGQSVYYYTFGRAELWPVLKFFLSCWFRSIRGGDKWQ
jgi:hypothetical protein